MVRTWKGGEGQCYPRSSCLNALCVYVGANKSPGLSLCCLAWPAVHAFSVRERVHAHTPMGNLLSSLAGPGDTASCTYLFSYNRRYCPWDTQPSMLGYL